MDPGRLRGRARSVSMKSGLDGRNNVDHGVFHRAPAAVSMKFGLDGRNNPEHDIDWPDGEVSQ